MNIGLVLSGGGARCFAQIGALKALEEQGLEPTAICGTSTGALLGALYAAGHRADKLLEIVEQIDYTTFLRPGSRSGLLDHSGVEAVLKPHLPEHFEDLSIPLAVTAVDIQNAELLVLREGPLLLAASASNAFPGLFEPVKYQDRYLMDGGILDNFPVDLGRIMSTDPLVAVNTVPSPRRKLDFEGQGEPRFMERLLAPLRGGSPGLPLIVEVLEKAYTITQSRLIEVRSAMFPAQLLITPELPGDFGIQDFDRLREAFDLGYAAGQKALASNPLGS